MATVPNSGVATAAAPETPYILCKKGSDEKFWQFIDSFSSFTDAKAEAERLILESATLVLAIFGVEEVFQSRTTMESVWKRRA